MTERESFNAAIQLQRQQLVDIGKRNPLTNTPLTKTSAKLLEITDELSEQVYKRLVSDGKKFTFLPKSQATEAKTEDEIEEEIYVPETLTEALHTRHTDSKLQTELTPEALHKKLLVLFRETRRIEEEQGINVLNLALGFLEYFDSTASSTPRYAPLILLPVSLERSSARSQFSLVGRDDEIEPNHSIANLLLSDFDIKLPIWGEFEEESISQYYQRIQEAIQFQNRWTIELNRMALGFFSFGKHRMYRDLDVQIDGDNALVKDLLIGSESSDSSSGTSTISAYQEPLDQRYQNPKDLGHILDADTSQTEVISKVSEGKNLVVQGPPGTGKSQTIANIIAVMALQGKKILFIAEKRAALEVVYRRLNLAGLGSLCLELHSQKSTRKNFYEELRKTMELGPPLEVSNQKYDETRTVRDELNKLSSLLHTVDELTGNTPYLLMGRISKLLGEETPLADFELAGIDQWSTDEFDENLKCINALAEHTRQTGVESSHLWRGVSRRMNAANRIRLDSMLQNIEKLIRQLLDLVRNEIAWEPITQSVSITACKNLVRLFDLINEYSDSWTKVISHPELADYGDKLLELCEKIYKNQEQQRVLEEQVVSGAFRLSWELVLRDLKLNEKSIFRMFNGAYKRAKQQLLSITKVPLKRIDAQIKLAEELMQCELLVTEIKQQSEFGRTFLSLSWEDENTDVQSTLKALQWLNQVLPLVGGIRYVNQFLEHTTHLTNSADIRQRLTDCCSQLTKSLDELATFAEVDWQLVTDGKSLSTFELTLLHERVQGWIENIDRLDEYSILISLADELDRRGLGIVREHLASGELAPSRTKDTIRLHRAEAVFNRLVIAHPEIRQIDGSDRTRKVERFAKLDSELQRLSAQELACKHYKEIPRGQTGQLALLRGEMNKKSRQMSIRNLLIKASDAVLQIKPVFMMSPLSVAQYLDPSALKFDLLLIDEASQVKPAEALGAILRCKQVVVVGDQKQMPPTSFFDRQMSAEDEDDEDVSLGSQAAHMESILSLCDARAMDRAMLSWHYRSEHPSLIEVSNHEFYENKLTYPPSPFSGIAYSGLSFVQTNGVYMRGRLRNNPIEAETICEHVLKHAQEFPSQSLGVVALSVAQRDMIDNKMEFIRAKNPEVDAFCSDAKEEPFFVKNLENVQGDERDVIFISIGYGKDSDGYFAQAFGPVSSEGGERRLNVLFTRARKKCTVFSSISHDDIRTDVSAHAGPRVLKSFLKYAATGDMDVPRLTGEEFDSPFEEDVANVILSFGFHVEGQVGTSGFKIDLVVCDPQDASRYLLAVECDGARYHSSAWARERDRLRQQVLEGKGWKFHRIWSTDWFYNREVEIKKLLAAIEVARGIQPGGLHSTSSDKDENAENSKRVNIARDESSDHSTVSSAIEVVPYVPVELDVSMYSYEEIHEVYVNKLAVLVKEIVEVEGPVHEHVITRRIILAWGVKRLGTRIHKAIDEAIKFAEQSQIVQRLADEKQFLVPMGYTSPILRDRSARASFVRKVEHIPLAELKLGITQIIQDGISVSRDECVQVMSRKLGFGRMPAELHEQVKRGIEELIRESKVKEKDEILRLV